jgi:hypothetical protein
MALHPIARGSGENLQKSTMKRAAPQVAFDRE